MSDIDITHLVSKVKERLAQNSTDLGSHYIPDIIEYLKDYLEKDPTCTITVGCDSVQKRRRTVYAITIMLYNTDIKRGAHVVFFRESCDKIRDNKARLYKEAQYLNDVGNYLDTELATFYTRKDLTEVELTIPLNDRALNFEVQTTPSIKTFPNANLIPFDLDEWDSIVMEIKPAVERIKDLGYNCKIFMKPYNKILIRVTTDIDSPYTSYL